MGFFHAQMQLWPRNSFNGGEGDEVRVKTKVRWHSYFHILYHNYKDGAEGEINFILKFPRAEASGIFPSCQLIS